MILETERIEKSTQQRAFLFKGIDKTGKLLSRLTKVKIYDTEPRGETARMQPSTDQGVRLQKNPNQLIP